MSMTVTISERFAIGGPNVVVPISAALDSSYVTGGYSLTPSSLGLLVISQVVTVDSPTGVGYAYAWNSSTQKLLLYDTTATGLSNSTSAVTGTGTFLGTSTGSLNVTTPAFSGTGQASSGQVITTTDNQTMLVNQCAGMWFVSATHGPYLIASNTAVAGAPAVLTIVGTAPTTDAGAYQILKNILPTGSVTALSGTAAAQTISGTGSFAQVPNGTNVSAVTAQQFLVIGH